MDQGKGHACKIIFEPLFVVEMSFLTSKLPCQRSSLRSAQVAL